MAAADQAEMCRQLWTKSSVEKRKERLRKEGCDPEWISTRSNEQLVQAILVAEGYAEGELVKIKVAADPIAMLMEQFRLQR